MRAHLKLDKYVVRLEKNHTSSRAFKILQVTPLEMNHDVAASPYLFIVK